MFNDYDMSTFYGDKNLYDIIINSPRPAETILRNIRGQYFDSKYNGISLTSAKNILLEKNTDLIIKPSRANNGRGVRKLTIKDNKIHLNDSVLNFDELIKMYKEDFIIQNVIQQHHTMAAPHPSSVNTIRMVTLRWKNEIRLLMAFARFGNNNDIRDNGHVDISPCLSVSDSGEFSKIAVSKSGETYTHHPTTGYCFADLEPIPNFDEFKQFVFNSHKNILHLNFISWDIAVGVDGKPIFIEANFAGSTPFYQLAAQRPIFGEITEEVLDYVKNQIKTKKPKLMKKHRKKLAKKELVARDQELAELKKQLAQVNAKYNKVINSRTYKLAKSIQKISNLFRTSKSK